MRSGNGNPPGLRRRVAAMQHHSHVGASMRNREPAATRCAGGSSSPGSAPRLQSGTLSSRLTRNSADLNISLSPHKITVAVPSGPRPMQMTSAARASPPYQGR